MKIINMTQHTATPEQIEAGVFDPTPVIAQQIKTLLTFDEIPSPNEMARRAKLLAVLADEAGADAAMIGGAPFFMSALERTLAGLRVKPLYAFSRRESVEEVVNGQTVKKSVFKHAGFVEGCAAFVQQEQFFAENAPV